MSKKWWMLLAVNLMVLTTAGCGHAPTVIESVGTSDYIKITSIKGRDVDGNLNLNIEFTNPDSDDRIAYYRINWLDADDFPVWGEEPWKPILLHGGQTKLVSAIAPTSKARHFKIVFSAKDNSR